MFIKYAEIGCNKKAESLINMSLTGLHALTI